MSHQLLGEESRHVQKLLSPLINKHERVSPAHNCIWATTIGFALKFCKQDQVNKFMAVLNGNAGISEWH